MVLLISTCESFWQTLKEREISQYALIRKKNFSNTTLARIKKGKHISTATIDQLCEILNCRVEDIVIYLDSKHPCIYLARDYSDHFQLYHLKMFSIITAYQ